MQTKLTAPVSVDSAAPLAGRYVVDGLLGRGASAAVLDARDEHTGERRALKLLQGEAAREDELRAEFARLSRLQHPNLIRVHDVGRIDAPLAVGSTVVAAGTLFLVLDRLEGIEPAAALREVEPAGRSARLRRIAAEVAEALAHLHRHGLRHHDVKPDNIRLDSQGRAILIDLGLAAEGRDCTGARGTVAYMAPEALAAAGDHRTDLYGLGATLFHLAAGRAPFDGAGVALVRQVLEQPPELAGAAWLDDATRDLIHALLRKDPARRPASARVVLAELARIDGDTSRVAELSAQPEVLPPVFVGRRMLVERLERCFEALHGETDEIRPALILLEGAPGSGKTRVLHEARRAQQIRFAAGRTRAVSFLTGLPRPALHRSDAPAAEDRDPEPLDTAALRIADELERHARREPLVLHLPELEGDPLLSKVLHAVVAGAEAADASPLLIVAEVPPQTEGLPAGRLVQRLGVSALRPAEVAAVIASMSGAAHPADVVERMQALSGGNARLLVELARQWLAGGQALDALALDDSAASALAAVLSSRRRILPPARRQILDALAVWDEAADMPTLAALLQQDPATLWPDLESLVADGSISLHGGAAALPSAAHNAAWRAAAGAELTPLHRRAAELCSGSGPSARQAMHLLQAGEPAGLPLALEAGRQLAHSHRVPAAVALLERVAASERADLGDAARRLLADLYVQSGRYDEAISLAAGPELALLRARALQRRGDYSEAQAELTTLIERLPAGEEQRQATALLGQILVRRGRAHQALRATEAAGRRRLARAEQQGRSLSAGDAALIEVVALASYYLGDRTGTEALLQRAEQAVGPDAPASRTARLRNIRGMAAFGAGRPGEAAQHYRTALDHARRAGDVHGAVTYAGNLGSTLVELGRYREALCQLSMTVRDLRRLGRTTELAAAICNVGSLLALLGDAEQAERHRCSAAELLEQLETPQHAGYVLLLEGDLARLGGQLEHAAAVYRRAGASFARVGDQRDQVLAQLLEADVLVALGDVAAARRTIAAVNEAEQPVNAALARARLALAEPAETQREQTLIALTQELARHGLELERSGAAPRAWRLASLLGQLLARLGRCGAARQALARARQIREVVMKEAPAVYRERMDDDPDARSLAAQWEALVQAQPGEGQGAVAQRGAVKPHGDQRLRRLLGINKRLNTELHLPRLLELIIDAVIELTDAERGFLILVEDDGALSIKVARNIDHRSLEGEELAVSRSIAEQAARTATPVITIDAADDRRFAEALSVSDLRLRSVLAVPLAVKGRVVGTIYVDHRLRRGVFGDEEVALVQDFCDQAAIAIDNARLLSENQRRQGEIEALNEQLTEMLQSQREELIEVREELRSSKEALQIRYDYANIIGLTPKMQELFRLLDRVTDTQLPVVIRGESGTGKELVARAIHFNGLRSGKPFVGENCGAIPETLLESILFGYERGAFTGAERDRKGLFEVANGGTLFLDEVGEMSPAMQTKLLRVLQDGEFRRVGGERTLRTDVRIIAASNRDLGQFVQDGGFREDLYYRLNVIRIEIPPLRERREDIPLLVDHFLAKHAGPGRRIGSATLARLMGYRWPGNVRELENEIMRVAALAGEHVGPEDLSPHIGGSEPLQLRDADDLRLRPRIEHLERELIQRALQTSRNNQSQAARLLGLSRYGLLKKMRRYFGEASSQEPK